MTSLVNRFSLRSLAFTLFLAIVFGVGLLSLHRHTRPAQAQVADPGRAQVILDWYAARNRGDDDAAAALFAENAFFVGVAPRGFCSMQTPCYDRASELQNLQQVAATTPNQCFTVTSIEVSGNIVTGRSEARNDINRSRGIERVIAAFLAEVRDGKIIAFLQRLDTGDPQTALNGAIGAGSAQPIAPPLPTPNPPCG